MNFKKGFTLIELLVVIAIIGILTTIVVASTTSSKTKANTAAAKKIASSIVPNLIVCSQEVNGGVGQPTSTSTGGGPICTVGANVATWPSVAATGYVYNTPVDTNITDGVYTFTLTKTSSPNVTCSIATGACN